MEIGLQGSQQFYGLNIFEVKLNNTVVIVT